MVTPYDRARAVYDREPCARPFESDLLWHLTHGYVVSTPDAFAMARPVWRHWPIERLSEPWETDAAGDCWWVWLLAGRLDVALRWLPWETEWIGYERGNVPRFVPLKKLVRKKIEKSIDVF